MSTQVSGLPFSSTKWGRIVDRANRDPSAQWSSLFHLLDGGLFERCFHRLDGKKAVGVDGISKDAYGQNLDQNLKALVLSIRKGTYVPKPAKFEEVPKPDGTMRPLAISCFEDKIVQSALKELLEVLYEPIFVDDSHGFRPGRGCDTALVDLRQDLMSKDCGALIDIDLKSFFNSIPHDILIKFLEMKIKQPDLIYLILKIMRSPIQNKDGSAVANVLGVRAGRIYCEPGPGKYLLALR